MTAPLTAWVQGHKGPAAAGAGAVVVGALALRARSKSGAAAGGSSAAASSDGTSDTSATQAGIAGLTGDPDDYATQIENWVQDQLNEQNTQVADALTAKPAAPVVPKPAPAAPKPGTVHYTIRSGDTLAKIAAAVYGTTASWAVQAIRSANPILAHFGDNTALTYYGGDSITIANAKPPAAKKPAPAPKKPAPKPKPKPKPKKK